MIQILSILLLLSSCSTLSDSTSEFWDEKCLVTELHPCGKKKIEVQSDQPLSEEDKKILMCRVNGLVKCRIHRDREINRLRNK